MSIFQRVAQIANGLTILNEWVGSGGVPVDKELAQARANVCVGCPLNTDGGDVTDAIADAIKQQIELKNQLELRVDGEKRLKACQACGCVMRLKVWVPFAFIAPTAEEKTKLDPNCWQLTETV